MIDSGRLHGTRTSVHTNSNYIGGNIMIYVIYKIMYCKYMQCHIYIDGNRYNYKSQVNSF